MQLHRHTAVAADTLRQQYNACSDGIAVRSADGYLSLSEDAYSGEFSACVENVEENDARFEQTIAVEPNAYYRISCMVKAEGCQIGRAGVGLTGGILLRFVGPLSRFGESHAALKGVEKDLDVVAVISGVEPSRTRFEDRLRRILQKIPGRHVMILGQPSVPYNSWTEGNIEFHTHLPTDRFAEIVTRSKRVVSRGGYSTVMDMAVLGASCIFVPIPGQYEQIVLAKNLSAAGYAVEILEDKLSEESLRKALSVENRMLPPFRQELLRGSVDDLFQKIGK